MKGLIVSICLIGGLAFATSCSTKMMLTSKVKASEIDTVVNLGSIAYIGVYTGNQNIYLNDTCCKAMMNVNKGLTEILSKEMIVISSDSNANSSLKLRKSLIKLVKAVEKQTTINKITIPAYLDSVLTIQKANYGVFTYHNGYIMSDDTFENYRTATSVATIVSIALLHPMIWDVNHANSTLVCCIIDRKNHNIAFYRKNVWDYWTPTNKIRTDKQLQAIFGNYLKK